LGASRPRLQRPGACALHHSSTLACMPAWRHIFVATVGRHTAAYALRKGNVFVMSCMHSVHCTGRASPRCMRTCMRACMAQVYGLELLVCAVAALVAAVVAGRPRGWARTDLVQVQSSAVREWLRIHPPTHAGMHDRATLPPSLPALHRHLPQPLSQRAPPLHACIHSCTPLPSMCLGI
jgi:hypothetical protein